MLTFCFKIMLNFLSQWFSAVGDSSWTTGTFSKVCRYSGLPQFLRGVTGVQGVEVSYMAKHPLITGQAPQPKNRPLNPAQSIKSATVEKTFIRISPLLFNAYAHQFMKKVFFSFPNFGKIFTIHGFSPSFSPIDKRALMLKFTCQIVLRFKRYYSLLCEVRISRSFLFVDSHNMLAFKNLSHPVVTHILNFIKKTHLFL